MTHVFQLFSGARSMGNNRLMRQNQSSNAISRICEGIGVLVARVPPHEDLVFVIILWCIWKRRNECVWEVKNTPTNISTSLALQFVFEWSKVR